MIVLVLHVRIPNRHDENCIYSTIAFDYDFSHVQILFSKCTHRPLPSYTSLNKSSTPQFQQNCTWYSNRKEYFPDDEDSRCKQNNIIRNSRARHQLFRRLYQIFSKHSRSMTRIQKHLQITIRRKINDVKWCTEWRHSCVGDEIIQVIIEVTEFLTKKLVILIRMIVVHAQMLDIYKITSLFRFRIK